MGFTENQLVEIYLQDMMPLVEYPEGLVRLDHAYGRVLKLLGKGVDMFGFPLSQTPFQRELDKRLFGQQVIAAAPDSWVEAEAILAANLFEHQWYAMPIESRARWRASKRIQGMVQLIERYRDEIDSQAKRKKKS